jgi:peptidoglycan/xylan/chitin deacetylase (PgdA/CDA1 family)
MIGVAVHPSEREIVTEFFELFKTQWEFCRRGGQYEIVLSTVGNLSVSKSRLLLIFGGESDTHERIKVRSRSGGVIVSDEGKRLPIYGALATFPGSPHSILHEQGTGEPAAIVTHGGGTTTLRVGYNLFAEARFLLTAGQPVANAEIPTLEEHIGWLRDWITRAGIPSVEIPPVPDGYNFVSCLTHDIDHPGLRNHRCDHTMFGFLYRSTIGTLIKVCSGRKPFKSLWMNWTAAGQLPFVHLGLANDFWADFDRYPEIEGGYGATFFVIPRRAYAGRTLDGPAPSRRACHYDVNQLLPKLNKIVSAGCEVGVHGLDAWLDTDRGRDEHEIVSQSIGIKKLGVRMHWLYFNENSPVALDRAGFNYDTTVGYTETIGYRAGTTQAYRPLGATTLLELPLHVMDTALFYPSYLNLTEKEAEQRVSRMLNDAERIGGALTINWHDRSIAPERLWGDFYLRLLGELKTRGAWLPNAATAVAWFRKRRSAAVEWNWSGTGTIRVRGRLDTVDTLPGLKIRVFKPRSRSISEPLGASKQPEFFDQRFDKTTDINFFV